MPVAATFCSPAAGRACKLHAMNLRSCFFAVVLCWCLSMPCGAEELSFGFYPVPAKLFTPEEAAKIPKSGKADIAAVLKQRGLELPRGSAAFYDAAAGQIFLRSTPRDLDQLAWLFEDLAADGAPESRAKEVKVSRAPCFSYSGANCLRNSIKAVMSASSNWVTCGI